ncbi:MAG: ribokinase [Clostridia bacterium]|nr:ribokinase [Clostridia bacterium]
MKHRVLVVSSANMDFVQRIDKIPSAGQTVVTDCTYSYIPGGKGANSAVAFARLGADTVFCTRVGKDSNGAALKRIYQKEGIDTRFLVEDVEKPTGLASIIVEDDGANRIIVYPGANTEISENEIEDAFTTYPDAVFLQFEIPFEAVVTAAEFAAEQNIPMFVDAGPVNGEVDLSRLKKVEILSPNESECEALTGIYPDSLENCLRACIRLCSMVEIKYVVLKLGKRGAFVYDGKYYHLVQGHKVNAVDTTAAGDVFSAAVTYAYLKKGDILEATRFANLAAALSVTKEGAFPSIPTLAEVKEFSITLKSKEQ